MLFAMLPKQSAKKQAKPRPFDFASLQTRIVAASTKGFADLARLSPKDPVCSFALYSDDGAMTVCPSFDTTAKLAERLASSAGDLSYKFCPPEWAYESKGADREFNRICDDVGTFVMKIEELEVEFSAFRDQLFETCLSALDELRAAPRFPPAVLLMFDVSDSNISKAKQLARMKRLNPGSPHLAEFSRWAKSWAKA
ncbi:hypothetical protein BH11MYX2_BH11MYX2_11220 [soil metagenome]